MPLGRALILAVVGVVIALPAAVAADTTTARFLVTVRGTVTKQWSYRVQTRSGDCTRTVSGSGTRTIRVRSADASVVAGSWPGPRAPATFDGAVRLAGAIRQSGSKTTRDGGPAGCPQDERHPDCGLLTRTFQNRSMRLVSGRPRRLGFRRIPGLVPDVFYNGCPGEPSAVRRLAGGINLADAAYSEKELFDRSTAGVTLRGSTDVTTKLFSPPGSVLQRARWTLTLRRLGA